MRRPHIAPLIRVGVVALLTGSAVTACAANSGAEVELSAAAEAGREISRTNGCSACHGRNGEGGPGPAFVGLSGSTVEFDDGTTAVADDDYLYESITDPAARVVAGYGFPMPENDLDDEQVQSVIAYIEELSTPTEAGS